MTIYEYWVQDYFQKIWAYTPPPPHFFCRCFEFSCCLVCTDMKISDFILIAMKFLSKK